MPSPGSDPVRPRLSATRSALIGGLLAVPIIVPLLVFIYARQSPTLDHIPFFFWFQFVLIPFAAAFTWAAYLVVSTGQRPGQGVDRP